MPSGSLSGTLRYLCLVPSWCPNVVQKREAYLVFKSTVKICPVWVLAFIPSICVNLLSQEEGKLMCTHTPTHTHVSVLLFLTLYLPTSMGSSTLCVSKMDALYVWALVESNLHDTIYIFGECGRKTGRERHYEQLQCGSQPFSTWKHPISLWNVCEMVILFTLTCLTFRCSHFTFTDFRVKKKKSFHLESKRSTILMYFFFYVFYF